MDETTFIIAEDQDIILKGLCAHISSIPSFNVSGMAKNGYQVINLIHKENPDIVLMDLKMPEMNGPLATKKIKEYSPDIKVIILTAYSDELLIYEALEAGADAYLLKNVSDEELIFAVKMVRQGKKYITPDISLILIEDFLHKTYKSKSPLLDTLSKREIEILRELALGNTSKEIAQKLFISSKTVEAHKNNIKNKLKTHNTTDLVVFAIQNNLLPNLT